MIFAMSATSDPFGLGTTAVRDDPYPIYARLRREAPVHFSEAWGAFVVTRYADVVAGFRDPRLSASRAGAIGRDLPAEVRKQLEPLVQNLSCWALLLDPPDHTRLRALVSKAFSPRLTEQLRPRIESLVNELLDRAEGPEVDLIEAIANPLPVTVIGDMLGLPRSDAGKLKLWSDSLAAFFGGALTRETVGQAVVGIVEMEAYFRGALAERRRAPRGDLLSALLAAEEGGSILSEQELLSTAAMILFGGHETTTNLVGNAIHHLSMDRDQRERLLSSNDHVETAVEEILRFESPVQRMGRLAKDDLTIAGVKIDKGARVYLVMGSANRDEAQFPGADRLDVTRRDNKHLGLGFGLHYCVGAALGRLEAQVAIPAILRRWPGAQRIDERPQWHDNLSIRGLRGLRLRV